MDNTTTTEMDTTSFASTTFSGAMIGQADWLDQIIMVVVVALVAGFLGLIAAAYMAYFRVMKAEKGTDQMIDIANNIKIGSKAFLNREYTYIAIYVVLMMIIVGIVTIPEDILKTLLSFLIGAVLSGLTGYIGMLMAVEANVRTANAARNKDTGLNDALQVAFGSGAVMGLAVVSIVLLGLVMIYSIWGGLDQDETRYLAGFGFGASSIALFARVGGGIYTKAADVGADLVGKIEANIPEDDPRNPATIADNVGDNVGDVAGMGADLFESFAGSIIATIQLSEEGLHFAAEIECDCHLSVDAADLIKSNEIDGYHFVALPFWITGFGLVASIIGLFLIRTTKNPKAVDLQSVLLWTIRRGIITATILSSIMAMVTCGIFFGFDSELCWRLWGSINLGLVAGELIGLFTEYVTSFVHKPTKSIAKK
eukprot:156798_1